MHQMRQISCFTKKKKNSMYIVIQDKYLSIKSYVFNRHPISLKIQNLKVNELVKRCRSGC